MTLYYSFTFAIVCIFALLVYALVDDIRKCKRNMQKSQQLRSETNIAVQSLGRHILRVCPVCEVNHLPDDIVYCCDKCAACQDDWSVVVNEYPRDIRNELYSLQQFMDDMNISTVVTHGSVHMHVRNKRISFDVVRALHNRGLQAKCIKKLTQTAGKSVDVYTVKGIWLITGSQLHDIVATKRAPVTISRKQWSDAVINMQLELI